MTIRIGLTERKKGGRLRVATLWEGDEGGGANKTGIGFVKAGGCCEQLDAKTKMGEDRGNCIQVVPQR